MALELLAAGLTSLREIGGPAGGEDVETRRLNLHMNRIQDLGGLSHFRALEELILSGNCISQVRPLDFQSLGSLKVLDLSCNELRDLDTFKGLYALERLHLAYNRIESLEGVMNFWGRRHQLKRLDLRCNKIYQLSQLLFLGGCTTLEQVAFKEKSRDNGNAICDDPMYCSSILKVIPWIKLLDDVPSQEIQSSPAASQRDGTMQKMKHQLAEATMELQTAEEEAKMATEEARKAKERATEAAQERDLAVKEAESQRESRLRADLEEIVVAVQKHEDQFAEQLARLSAADQELPATERLHEEETTALTKEEARCLQLSSSEKHEASVAARWKSEKLEAEQMLLQCRARRPALPDVQVQNLKADLQQTSQQLHEIRSALKSFDEEDELQRLAAIVVNEENSVLEAQKTIGEHQYLARCWNLETAAAASRLAALRGSEARQARAGAEEMEAQEIMAQSYQEGLSKLLSEERQLQNKVDSSFERQIDGASESGEMQALMQQYDWRKSEIQEMQEAKDDDAVSILEEKLQSVLDQALQGFEQSRARVPNLELDLSQKAKALQLAKKQEALDKLVLGEMQLQLQRRKDAEKDIFLEVSQRLADTTSIEFEVHEIQESVKDICKKIQELEELRVAYARQSDYEVCVQAVQGSKAEIAKLGEEKSERSMQLSGLLFALEKRREELRNLLVQLQESQNHGEQEERKLKVKTQMIADATQQVRDLKRSLDEAEKSKQENDIAWGNLLNEAKASADDFLQRSNELHSSSVQQENELAKMSRVVKAKGERNSIVRLQLDQVQLLTEEKKSQLEEKVAATQAEGAQIMTEARWASSEMEERFRLQRAEQLQEERRQRCRLVMLQQQLQAAPSGLDKLRRNLAEERTTSKDRLRRLLATFDGPRLTRSSMS